MGANILSRSAFGAPLALTLALTAAPSAQASTPPSAQPTSSHISGPTYALHEGDNRGNRAASTSGSSTPLPFNYTVNYQASVSSQTFHTTDSKVCVDANLGYVSGATNTFTIAIYNSRSQQYGSAANYKTGSQYGYCWSGMANGDYYFTMKKSGSTYYKGNGDAHQ